MNQHETYRNVNQNALECFIFLFQSFFSVQDSSDVRTKHTFICIESFELYTKPTFKVLFHFCCHVWMQWLLEKKRTALCDRLLCYQARVTNRRVRKEFSWTYTPFQPYTYKAEGKGRQKTESLKLQYLLLLFVKTFAILSKSSNRKV